MRNQCIGHHQIHHDHTNLQRRHSLLPINNVAITTPNNNLITSQHQSTSTPINLNNITIFKVAPMLVGRSLAAAVPSSDGGRVYAVGGVDSFGGRLQSVEYFDVHMALWHQAPPLNIARWL
jgi:hypothetical protein